MEAVKGFLAPLGLNANSIGDAVKLVALGETARRASISAWSGLVDSFYLTANFGEEDYPYDWLMHWLSKQPAWGRSREFEISTRSMCRDQLNQPKTVAVEEDMDGGSRHELEHDGCKRGVMFVPCPDTTHTIYYRGHWLKITRTRRYQNHGQYSALKISVVARNNDIFKRLVLEAKREYEKDAEHRVHIFMADTTYACWRWNGARQTRPMSSITLEHPVKETLLADCRDFLCSEDWYAERGIPYRRGYLVHGGPGSGKDALILSLAGELGLDIYVVNLSSKGTSDKTLRNLMENVPSHCILLLEGLDVAFDNAEVDGGSSLSLGGLLTSMDWVDIEEGRLIFATANHLERVDPALSRPGRMDVWVNLPNATKKHAEDIFKRIFRPASSAFASRNVPGLDTPQRNRSRLRRRGDARVGPVLGEAEVALLARRFADAIPEGEMSVASLQGYLLKNKARPRECVNEVAKWVRQERETPARIMREAEKRSEQR
ncbi:BCS1 N terminal-domain-containing protein [Russula dissimulans]|nr:BCS1 N terminal-domain-containing protein [Russula dissimulans]